MCKTPKVKQPVEKPVQYLSNPWLDGLAIGGERGRNSLRVDLGSTSGDSNPRRTVPYQPPPPHTLALSPNASGARNSLTTMGLAIPMPGTRLQRARPQFY